MSKRKRSSSPPVSRCEEGTSPTVKRHKSRQGDRAQQCHLRSRLAPSGGLDVFNARYEQGHQLGSGGFGSVYRGVRKSDGLKVALKYVPKDKVDYIPVMSCGSIYNIPKEVFLMYKAAGAANRVGLSAAVSLLDWFQLDTEILIVMERPKPSMDLLLYSTSHDPVPEETVRDILKKLVLAVKDLHQKRVFHRDLKMENILIQETEEGIRARIIDFGCGCTVSATPYTSFDGTQNYCPRSSSLIRGTQTVLLLCGSSENSLLNGNGTVFDIEEWVSGEQSMKSTEASEEGKHFLQDCLEADPSKRISLEELENHVWFVSTTLASEDYGLLLID